jgi:hypothetical protein
MGKILNGEKIADGEEHFKKMPAHTAPRPEGFPRRSD